MHAKAHMLYCQILWIGHWMDNAALTTGEEQEQVFKKMSRYNSVTKHMGKANNNDHLTAGIMHWNSEKERVMANLLMRRRSKAISLLRSSKVNLKRLLEEKQITREALTSLELDLKTIARKCLAEERSRIGTLSVTKLKLESSFVHMKNLQIKVEKVATSSIERKKFRQAETLVKKKASELIAKMNSFKNSEGKLYKLTMQDFEQGSWREEIYLYESFSVSDYLSLFSAQQHLNKVSHVSRLLTEKIERSANSASTMLGTVAMPPISSLLSADITTLFYVTVLVCKRLSNRTAKHFLCMFSCNFAVYNTPAFAVFCKCKNQGIHATSL
ncbi:hypothetical protein OUZ56_012503 [Daphnia magna]|uniref:Uncharacterized protein n=1 Tax=Daphnia magna TaxID=35525 RepID=A0ABQ9Z386_9CRUS|nr:hypothetical protein OUZ56_012503 [Daphnia magna]